MTTGSNYQEHRRRREEVGMKQYVAAKEVGVDRARMCLYEKGGASLSAAQVRKLERVLSRAAKRLVARAAKQTAATEPAALA